MVLSTKFRDTKLMSTGDVARELGVHRSTVWLWVRSGALPAGMLNGFHGVRPSDLAKFRAQYDTSTTRKQKRKKKAA
jgi:excisionase family DNA binding protein